MKEYPPASYLTGRSAFQVQFCTDDVLFSGKKLIPQKLLLYVFKSDSVYRICKTFSRITLFPEKKNRFFQYGKNFFLDGKYFVQRLAVGSFLSPASAYVNLVAIGPFIRRMERAPRPDALPS